MKPTIPIDASSKVGCTHPTRYAWGDMTMLASSRRNHEYERRGIVLVLVLAMLGCWR